MREVYTVGNYCVAIHSYGPCSELVMSKYLTDLDAVIHHVSTSTLNIDIRRLDALHAERGMILDSNPVLTMGHQGYWSYTHREDVVTVTPGMDIVISPAMNRIAIDKENWHTAAAAV